MEIEENVELENQENNTNNTTLENSEDSVNTEITTEEVTIEEQNEVVDETGSEDVDVDTGETSNEISIGEESIAQMSTSYIALSSAHLIISIILIFVVLQQSKSDSAISSGMDGSQTYWSKNKGRSRESKLAKITIILAVVFFFITLALNFIG